MDTGGNSLGEMDILEAHRTPGILHRAFSVYVFRNNRTELLIQRRSEKKMLWPGSWANTCCSHPYANEEAVTAGQRRLQEELGCVCDLRPEGSFIYQALDPSGKGAEHEYLTILTGDADLSPAANPDEVADWKWMRVADLQKDFVTNPDQYAPWFPLGIAHLFR